MSRSREPGWLDGIEIFPKQDELRREEFGNAIRGPLGVHWGARESRGWRYWFYGADYKLEDQLAYLQRIEKVKQEHLQRMIAGKTIPQEFAQRASRTECPKYFQSEARRVPNSGICRGEEASSAETG